MKHKPSLRNVIVTAQEFLTLVENCPPIAGYKNASENAETLRYQIGAYNSEVQAGKGFPPDQAVFEDRHARQLVQTLVQSAQLAREASQHPVLGRYVVDGGGSEWNRINPRKLFNDLSSVLNAEKEGAGRSHSAGHNYGPAEYEPHGHYAQLRILNTDNQTTSPVSAAGAVLAGALGAKASRFGA
jgi:hypothetical protein